MPLTQHQPISFLMRYRFAVAMAAASFCTTAHGAVNDIFPTDYISLQDGAVNATFYAYRRHQDGPYANGNALMHGKIESDIFAMRISRHMRIGEQYGFAPIAVLSWADSEASPLQLSNRIGTEARGLGDLRLGGSFWFHRDTEKRQYGAISLLATLPTGDYEEARILNVGENRWKWVLGGGLVSPLGERWVLDLAPEIAWYGENDAYAGRHRLEQAVSGALTGYLRFRATPRFQLLTGFQINRGGSTRLDGIDQHNAPDNTRLSLGLLYLTPDKQQWQLRYSRDADINAGFRTTDELTLRYSIVY